MIARRIFKEFQGLVSDFPILAESITLALSLSGEMAFPKRGNAEIMDDQIYIQNGMKSD